MQRYDKYRRIALVIGALAAMPAHVQAQPALPGLPAPGASSADIDLPKLPMPVGAPGATAPEPLVMPPQATPPATAPAAPAVVPDLPALPPTASAPKAAATAPAAQPVAPTAAGTSVSTEVQKPFSYGNSNMSLLFLPDQIERMKEAIAAYESVNRDAKPKFEETKPVTAAPVIQDVKEPDAYPSFYLSTIVYETPGEWSIWIGGHKITSRKNETDVNVISVTPDSVTLAWRPDYADAINKRRSSKQFASTDPVKNKLAVTQRISFDPPTGMVTFTLRQNQSFAVGYFSIFEGYMASPKLPPMITVATPSRDLGLGGAPVSIIDPATGLPTAPGAVDPGMPVPPGMQPPGSPNPLQPPMPGMEPGPGNPPSPGMPPGMPPTP